MGRKEIIESVKKGMIVINTIIAEIDDINVCNIWICPNGLDEVYRQCYKYLAVYRKQKNIEKIVVITTSEESCGCEDIVIRVVKSQEMDCILEWYRICNPSNEKLVVLSIDKPSGREGSQWMKAFEGISLDDICKVGLLRLRDK